MVRLKCAVLQDDTFGLDEDFGGGRHIQLQCSVGNQMFFAIVMQDFVEVRYRKRKLTREESIHLLECDLTSVAPLIAEKFQSGNIQCRHRFGRKTYPLILISFLDLSDS
jgi:hypothetical protein